MKQKIDRTKTETSKLGAHAIGMRSLALLMFFVMLLTAIGSGSLLNAFAVTGADNAADSAAAEAAQANEDDNDAGQSTADLYDT